MKKLILVSILSFVVLGIFSMVSAGDPFPIVSGQFCEAPYVFDTGSIHSGQCECPSYSLGWTNSGDVCIDDSGPVIICDFNGNNINEGQSIVAYSVSSTPYNAMTGCAESSEIRTCNNVSGLGELSGSYIYGSCSDGSPANCDFNGSVVAHGDSVTGYQDSLVPSGSSCVSEQRTCNNGSLNGSYDYTYCSVDSSIITGSCNLPGSGTMLSGDILTGFEQPTVACGSVCPNYNTIMCLDGVLSGGSNYSEIQYSGCSVSSCGGGGGGGGGNSFPTCELEGLICVDGIYEEIEGVNCRYGELGDECEIPEEPGTGSNDYGDLYDFTRIGDISNSPYSAELNLAYLYAYNMGITTMDNIIDANIEGNLIRSHMAKMLVERAVNVMGAEINTGVVCDFDDIDGLQGQDLYEFVLQSCQMGLMGLDSTGNPVESFDPAGVVTRAQFGTVLSRAIWGDLYNGATPYYENHLNALNTISIMNYISNPYMLELRGYVMLMLFRADEILD